MQILGHKGSMVDLDLGLGLFPQVDEANQRIASLHLNDTSPDNLSLIG